MLVIPCWPTFYSCARQYTVRRLSSKAQHIAGSNLQDVRVSVSAHARAWVCMCVVCCGSGGGTSVGCWRTGPGAAHHQFPVRQ